MGWTQMYTRVGVYNSSVTVRAEDDGNVTLIVADSQGKDSCSTIAGGMTRLQARQIGHALMQAGGVKSDFLPKEEEGEAQHPWQQPDAHTKEMYARAKAASDAHGAFLWAQEQGRLAERQRIFQGVKGHEIGTGGPHHGPLAQPLDTTLQEILKNALADRRPSRREVLETIQAEVGKLLKTV